MQVLAINGSPRRHKSSTFHMLENILIGARSAGASTKIINLRDYKIKMCIGCYKCWDRHPGECIFKDGMGDILAAFNKADLVIFGTPLYHNTMTGLMKDFFDRTIVGSEPWLIPHKKNPEISVHPRRNKARKKVFLVSPCGYPEFDHFKSIVPTFKHIAEMEYWDYLGEILRPGAEGMSRREFQGLFKRYYLALQKAGSSLIERGCLTVDIVEELNKDLLPGGKEVFLKAADIFWHQQQEKYMRIRDKTAKRESKDHSHV